MTLVVGSVSACATVGDRRGAIIAMVAPVAHCAFTRATEDGEGDEHQE